MAARPHRCGAGARSVAGGVLGTRVRFRRGALDGAGGHRGRRAGACAHRLAVRTIRLARRGRLPEPRALRNALRIRRTSRAEEAGMSGPRSDALVFFGATGDLAKRKIYPALLSLSSRGQLDMPVICVARPGWTAESLR